MSNIVSDAFNFIVPFFDDGTVNSLWFRLFTASLTALIVLHLLIKRLLELKRRDFIFKFRVSLAVIFLIVFVTSIPIIWNVLYRIVLPEVNQPLRDFATVMSGIGPLVLVIGFEIGDIIIAKINSRTRRR